MDHSVSSSKEWWGVLVGGCISLYQSDIRSLPHIPQPPQDFLEGKKKRRFQTFRSVHIFCLHFGQTNDLLHKCLYTVDLLAYIIDVLAVFIFYIVKFCSKISQWFCFYASES